MFLMEQHVMITGVNGLVGKAIAGNLISDCRLSGLGRNPDNRTGLQIGYYSVDLADSAAVMRLAHAIRPTVIVHCAAAISNDNWNPSLIDTNVRGLINLLDFAKISGCKKIVYISSLPIVGIPQSCPITEEHPVYPRSVYHLTKYFGELFLQAEAGDMEVVILRLPSPVGAGMPPNKILPVFIVRCLRDEPISLLGHGGREQNYVNVRDVAQAVRKAIERPVTGLFNIAYSRSYSNLELAELCKQTLHSDSELLFAGEDPDETMRWVYSIEKAQSELGFVPAVTLEQSIREIAASLSEKNENTRSK